MSGTNIPSPTFTTIGYVGPSEQAILAGALLDIGAAFGSGTNLALTTPQGQLASTETAVIGDNNAQLLAVLNGVDPAFATGRLQDAIGRIYFQDRFPGQPTSTSCTFGGGGGVVIPGNVPIAQDGNGFLYQLSSAATISAAGTVVATAFNTVDGPIGVTANTLEVALTVPGWDTITNSNGILGAYVETAQAFEYRRALSVASNSVNSNQSVQGAILALPTVLDCYVTDNPTNGTVTIGGVSVNANTLYVAVSGGDTTAVATALWDKAPPGIPTQGATVVTVQDDNPAYMGSGPSYSISYTTASTLPLNFQVNIPNTSGVPNNATLQVFVALQNAFAGVDGLPKASRIGIEVVSGRFYPGIAALGSWAIPISILLGSASPTLTSVTPTIAQIPTLGSLTLSLV